VSTWPVEHISVDVTHAKEIHGDGIKRDVFTRTVSLKGDLDEAQRARMLEIADKCPVHRTLEAGSDILTKAGH